MKLIDADALIEELHHMIEGDADLRKDYEFMGIDDCIKSMPTAYNVDKVIHKIHCYYIDRIDDAKQEEIEKLKQDNKVICGIIRNGGKE